MSTQRRNAHDVMIAVRDPEGVSAHGGVRYADAVAYLLTREGEDVTYEELADALGVLPCQAKWIATDLLLSVYSVCVGAGVINLERIDDDND
jgi:hypothetical protein